MTSEELLLELKDIQSPAEPGWWLLAPGSMAVIGILVVVLTVLWAALRRRQVRRLVTSANQDLELIKSAYRSSADTRQLALEVAQWLKQVSLLAFPDRQLEGVSGLAWLHFLDEAMGDNRFSCGPGRVFADAVYSEHADFDGVQIVELCEQWLAVVEPHLLKRRAG